MRRTRAEALETRHRILDSAEAVFVEKGVADASLSDIAAAAGVTRGAIYGHFENKSDLLNAMVERVTVPLDAMVDAAYDPAATDPLGLLRDAFASCLRLMATDAGTRRLFTILLTNRDPGPAEWLHQRDRVAGADARRRIGRALRHAVARGQLPPELDVRLGAAVLKASMVGIMRDWLLDPASFTLPRDAQRLAGAVLDTLRLSQALHRPVRSGRRSA